MKQNLIQTFTQKKGVKEIIDFFYEQKIEIRFVGGCIRDALLKKPIEDIDFAVKSHPEKVINILKSSNIKFDDYAKKYGSFIIWFEEKKFQVTCLRQDFNQKGRDTNIRFTDSWKKDALRRDFTINALYLSLTGNLYDYFSGLEDLSNQQVKFIGDIDKRITEDYLRIFRYFRFLGCFEELNVLSDYEKIILKYIPSLNKFVSNEAMRIELLKMLKNHFPINSFQDFIIKNEKNNLIKQVNNWWLEDNYVLGIKCMKRINNFF